MSKEITVPTLGESVTEGTIGEWLKKPGDAVAVEDERYGLSYRRGWPSTLGYTASGLEVPLRGAPCKLDKSDPLFPKS